MTAPDPAGLAARPDLAPVIELGAFLARLDAKLDLILATLGGGDAVRLGGQLADVQETLGRHGVTREDLDAEPFEEAP